jgi:hypothetical protein
MASNPDGHGEIKSNSPFRAAPLEKSVGYVKHGFEGKLTI